MNNYLRRKANVRDEAIEWQLHYFAETSHYASEIAEATERFYKLGKRYGLLKEFRENGIC